MPPPASWARALPVSSQGAPWAQTQAWARAPSTRSLAPLRPWLHPAAQAWTHALARAWQQARTKTLLTPSSASRWASSPWLRGRRAACRRGRGPECRRWRKRRRRRALEHDLAGLDQRGHQLRTPLAPSGRCVPCIPCIPDSRDTPYVRGCPGHLLQTAGYMGYAGYGTAPALQRTQMHGCHHVTRAASQHRHPSYRSAAPPASTVLRARLPSLGRACSCRAGPLQDGDCRSSAYASPRLQRQQAVLRYLAIRARDRAVSLHRQFTSRGQSQMTSPPTLPSSGSPQTRPS